MAARKNIAPRAKQSTPDKTVLELQDVQQQLQFVHMCLVTVRAALEGQNADNDHDFAFCMLRGAINPLSVQIERVRKAAGLVPEFGGDEEEEAQ